LTKKKIDSFKWDGRSRDIRWDGKDGVPFFGVRCDPGGSKTFMVEYRLPGNRGKTLSAIGGYGKWTLQQAHEEARRILAGVDRGIDPKAPTKAKELTVNDCAKVFLEDAQTRDVTTWRVMERRFEKHIIPALGRKILLDVSRADIARLHTSISQEPKKPKVEANRIVQLLKAMFNRAECLGLVPEGHRNPCEGVELHRKFSRARYWTTMTADAISVWS
jgi:hypothetical protein